MTNVYWGVPGAVQDGANATILVVADSWFWYPMDNLATEISVAMPNQTLVVIGNNGAEAAEWSEKYRKSIDFGFKMYAAGAQALILSGAGNDIAGNADFLRLIKGDCSSATTVGQCYGVAQPDATLKMIMGCYRAVITKFRAYNPTAPVFMHNYDNAWPTGKGLFGPATWLKAPMDFAQVPMIPVELRRNLFKDLVVRLHTEQLALAQEPGLGRLIPIESAGTMPDGPNEVDRWWVNELHPTPKGFKLLARQAFVPALKKVGLT